jgi:hypothetical protein
MGRGRVGPGGFVRRGRSVSVVPATRGVHVPPALAGALGYDNLARPADATGKAFQQSGLRNSSTGSARSLRPSLGWTELRA